MAKVGDLKAYHDGASYSVAELYDAESYEVTKILDENIKFSMRFDTDSGVIEECGNTAKYYSNNTIVDAIAKISDEHAKFDYALSFNNNDTNYMVFSGLDNNIVQGTSGFTIEGWFFVDTSAADSGTGGLFTLQRRVEYYAGNGLSSTVMCSVTYTYNEEEDKITTNFLNSAKTFTFAKGTFSQPFHLAFVYKSSTAGYIFFNGTLIQTISQIFLTTSKWSNFFLATVTAKWTTYYFGTNAGYTTAGPSIGKNKLNGSISEFKVTKKALYTADFTPPNKSSVWAKIPVEGNVAFKSASGTLYAPLSSDATYKTPPCLNVRHNGANYFAIK